MIYEGSLVFKEMYTYARKAVGRRASHLAYNFSHLEISGFSISKSLKLDNLITLDW